MSRNILRQQDSDSGRLFVCVADFHTEDNPPDFTGGRIMRREPGKPKLFRCRQCDFVADEKVSRRCRHRRHRSSTAKQSADVKITFK